MGRPTRQPFRGRLIRLGERERRVRPAAAPGWWRQHVHKESVRDTGSPMAWSAMTMPGRDIPSGVHLGSITQSARASSIGGTFRLECANDAIPVRSRRNWETSFPVTVQVETCWFARGGPKRRAPQRHRGFMRVRTPASSSGIISRRDISGRNVSNLSSRMGSSGPSRSCLRRTPRGAWQAASRWHWR
jgi:hypothetical protein